VEAEQSKRLTTTSRTIDLKLFFTLVSAAHLQQKDDLVRQAQRDLDQAGLLSKPYHVRPSLGPLILLKSDLPPS
jgi:hypothetical protein